MYFPSALFSKIFYEGQFREWEKSSQKLMFHFLWAQNSLYTVQTYTWVLQVLHIEFSGAMEKETESHKMIVLLNF